MHRPLPLILLLIPGLAFALPALDKTDLYSAQVSGCMDVDLATWQHPTRAVLEKNHVKLERVQLCNDRHYPIFHVQLPYDPQGQSQSYFAPLYEQMRKANGKWPYALVATSDNTVVSVSYRENGTIDLDYEMYQAP